MIQILTIINTLLIVWIVFIIRYNNKVINEEINSLLDLCKIMCTAIEKVAYPSITFNQPDLKPEGKTNGTK